MNPLSDAFLWSRRVSALIGHTVRQLSRMKTLYFLIFFCLALAGVGVITSRLTPDEELRLVKNVCFATMRWFGIVISIAATAILIPRDMEDRTLYTVLSKPVPRIAYLLGKYLGVLALIAFGILLMGLVFNATLWWTQQGVMADQVAQAKASTDDPVAVQEVMARIRALGVTWNLQSVAVGIFLECAVLTAATLLLSTLATSTMFTILMGTGVFLIGHMVQTAQDILSFQPVTLAVKWLSNAGILLFPNLSLFDLGNYEVVSSGALLPSGVLLTMAWHALAYIGVYLFAAWAIFSSKEF